MPGYTLEIVAPQRWGSAKTHVVEIDTGRTLCGVFIHRPKWLSPRKPQPFGDSQRASITCTRCQRSYIRKGND